ncbi:MAG: DUF4238 domain-containing protein, partial [Hyphomicrobium sp.]
MTDQDHHYLPRFHLGQWCAARGNVGVFSRPHAGKLVFSTKLTPKGTGFERNLYALRGAVPNQRHIIEATFFTPMIDTPASEVMPKLLAGKVATITDGERSAFTRYVLSLRVRHPDAVAFTRKTGAPHFIEELRKNPEEYKALVNHLGADTLEDVVDREWPSLIHQDFGMLTLPDLITDEKLGERLFRMPWWTHDVSKGKCNLLLGDRPVIIEGGLDKGPYIAITPLSPWKLLFICNHLPTIDRWRKMSHDEVAKAVNKATVQCAASRVYAADNRHEALVEKYLHA